MRVKIVLVLLLACDTVSGQDWNPILHGRKYNYKADTSQFIQFGVWIDSAKWNGSDSVYHLNRIVTDCDSCPIPGSKLYNQGTFFNRRMQLMPDSSFWFHDLGSFLLRPGDSVNSSWLFDTINNVTATIINAYEDSLWGISDSFKTIELSTGDTIVIGKNLGVVRFPTNDSAIHFILTGIDMGPVDWGETVIDFWDIFGFEVGDVLQYTQRDAGAQPAWVTIETHKYLIQSAQVFHDSIQYQVVDYYYRSYELLGSLPPCCLTWRCIRNKTLTFHRTVVPQIVNSYPLEPVQDGKLGLEYFLPHFGQQNSVPTNYFHLGLYGLDTAIYFRSAPDTLVPEPWWPVMGFAISVGRRLGLVAHSGFYFESLDEYSLNGYVQDADSVGTLWPNSFFVGDCAPVPLWQGIEEFYSPLVLHPNPTTGWLQITLPQALNENTMLTISNTLGRSISHELIQPGQQSIGIDLSRHPAGLYLISAQSATQQHFAKVVKL